MNPRTDRLFILDAANNRIVNTGLVEKTPEQAVARPRIFSATS